MTPQEKRAVRMWAIETALGKAALNRQCSETNGGSLRTESVPETDEIVEDAHDFEAFVTRETS